MPLSDELLDAIEIDNSSEQSASETKMYCAENDPFGVVPVT
jgi:hypothetical protein